MGGEIGGGMFYELLILFLDEPTIGVDASSKLAVREFVKKINRERRVTVILTTHDMHDIEALAERVIVIGNGVILADTSFDSLRERVLVERRLVVEFVGEPPLLSFPGVEILARDVSSLELSFDPRTIAAPELISR